MKRERIILLLILLILFFLFSGQSFNSLYAKERFEKKFEKTVHLPKDGKIILKNVSGDIFVKSWNKEEVKIYALKISRASTIARAKENAEKVKIDVNKEDKTLIIETKYPKTPFKSINVSVNYNLMIPSEARIKVKSVSGDVEVENIGGEVDLRTVSGDITVDGAKNGIDCEAVSGDLEIKNVVGDIDIRTISGDIELINVKGSIDADCVSGEIEIENSEVKSLKAKTISGSITYKGKIHPEGEYEISTHSGNVKLEIPSDSAFDLEAKTFSGKIKSDFEVAVSGEISRKKITGSVNGGGADIDLSSFSGNIVIRKLKIGT